MPNLILEQPIDEHLKPVKDVDLVNSAMEISTTKVRIQDLEVTGTTTGISASVDVDSSLTDGSTNPVENNAVYDGLALKLNLSGGTMSGNVDFGDNDISNVDSLDADKLSIAGGTEMTAINDQDDMSGDSATALATQQSIKAYCDAVPLSTAYSKTLIKVMPNEFRQNDDYAGGRTANVVEDDTTDTLGYRTGHSVVEAFAFVRIPEGYDVTHVKVSASASTSSAVECYQYNYTTGATTSKGTGDFNATIDITDITASTTADLVIKILPASDSTLIYGAVVTIAST